MKYDMIIEHFLKKLNLINSAFWITPIGEIVDVSEYETHGIGALIIFDGWDKKDASKDFRLGERFADKLRNSGYVSGYIDPHKSLILTANDIDSIKKAKKDIIDLCYMNSIENIELYNNNKHHEMDIDRFDRIF